MRIGLTGGGASVDKVVVQAERAEADGFSSLWYASVVTGDPPVAMAIAGRQTERIELGTAVLQTYPCHPLLQANRAASVVDAMGRPGLTLGIGPSHRPLVEGVYGYAYDHPGRSTEEYLQILTGLLTGEPVDVDGADWTVHTDGRSVPRSHPVSVLVSALGPRLLRVAGAVADGTVLWMAPAKAIESHVVPTIAALQPPPADRLPASSPGSLSPSTSTRPRPEMQQLRLRRSTRAWPTTNASSRSVARPGRPTPPSSATKRRWRSQLQSLLDAGATDIWAAPFPVGDDPKASLRRTRDLLMELVTP